MSRIHQRLVGQRHQFRSIRSVQEFQERVPLSTFEDYAESIGQVRAGAANVLTSEAVRLAAALVRVPIDLVSTSAEREATIVLRHPFDG